MPLGYILATDNGLITGGISLLGTVTGIDLKTPGQTTLYTAPAGKSLIITDIFLVPTAASAIVAAPIIRIGKTALFTEWLPLTTLTGLNGASQLISLRNTATLLIQNIFAAADVVKLDVQTGATATTLTVTAYIYGFLF